MKRITLAIVLTIAFIFSVWPAGSVPAHAQDLCEYGFLVIVGTCQSPSGTSECNTCAGAFVKTELSDMSDENCPATDSSSVSDLFECCRACGGTFVPTNSPQE